jgi:hypothetical protein
MERQLPTGAAINQLEIVAREQPHEFAIRTTAGPTPFLYHYRFGVENGETIVQLDAQVALDGIAAFMPQLARGQARRRRQPRDAEADPRGASSQSGW